MKEDLSDNIKANTEIREKDPNVSVDEEFEQFAQEKAVELLDEVFPEDSYIEETEHGRVVDIEKMKEGLQELVVKNRSKYRNDRYVITQSRMALALLQRHKDEHLLTSHQVETGELSAKPLFYYPESADSAANSLDIADSEFHVPLWEMGRHALKSREVFYPTKDGSEISAMEARMRSSFFIQILGTREEIHVTVNCT